MYLFKENFNVVMVGGGSNEAEAASKDKLKDVISKELDMSSMFAQLENKNSEAIFKEIIDEDRADILEKNDKFLKNLELAKSGYYMAKDEYFLKKRKKFLMLLSKTFYFSDIKKKEYKEFRNYVSVLGKLKDEKSWKEKHEALLDENGYIMDMVRNMKPGELQKLKKKYNKTINGIQDILSIKDKDFTEHDFHDLRKKIRFVVYVMKTLNKSLKGPKHEEYKAIAKKYESISDALAQVREVTGQGYLSWKKHAKNILKENIPKEKAGVSGIVSDDVLEELPDFESPEMEN